MNASRKADRAAIAAQFEAVANKFGAIVERRDEPANPGYHGAGIALRFTLNGVGAMVDVDNLHGGEDSLIHWFNTDYPARKFDGGFVVAVGGNICSAPHHKATSCGNWDLLAAHLQAGLRKASTGTAFRAA